MPADRLPARPGAHLDRVDLVGGVLAVLVGVLYLLGDLTGLHVSGLGTAVAVLAVLGVAVVAAGLRRGTVHPDAGWSDPTL